MSQTESWFPGRLRDLCRDECLELLSSKSVGRVAYCTPDGPEVLPLNFVVEQDTVLFRTSPHSALGRQLRSGVAAFEVDEIDDYTESGWSVLVRGPVEAVSVDDLPELERRPRPWAAGLRPLHLRLTPHSITGRRLLPG